jgi:hypothetical protein
LVIALVEETKRGREREAKCERNAKGKGDNY